MSKHEKREIERGCALLKEKVEAFLRARGAAHDPQAFYPWRLQTTAGPLIICVADGWLACRFEDVDRAKRHFKVTRLFEHERFNPYSGKFNYQGYAVNPTGMGYLFKEFERDMVDLLPGRK